MKTEINQNINDEASGARQIFGSFSYNDSEGYKKSAEQLWEDVYQYPADRSFFKRRKEDHEEKEKVELLTIPSAKDAWSIYDPEKQQEKPFSIFKGKSKPDQTDSENEYPKPPKRGWAMFQSQCG